MYLSFLSIAWILGTFSGSIFNISPWWLLIGLLPLSIPIIQRNLTKTAIMVSLLIFCFIGGISRYASSINITGENAIHFYNEHYITIRGCIISDVEKNGKSAQFIFKADSMILEHTVSSVRGRIQVFVPDYLNLRYGDRLELTGYLKNPSKTDDYDYKEYLDSRYIYSIFIYPELTLIARTEGNPILSVIFHIRHAMADSLDNILPEPHSSLAKGILLGLRGNIPESLKDDFAASGTTHILAISGQNLSIVAGLIISLGILIFGRRHYIYVWLAIAVLLIYTALTGLNAPVIRATIMACAFLLAELFGRQKHAGPALFFAAAIMIGFDPKILWNTSFQMSFLAMCGLVFFAPPLQNFAHKRLMNTFEETDWKARILKTLTDSLIVTLTATISVWPVTAYYFHLTSLAGPLSSMMILPVMPCIIICGIIAATFGIFLLPLGFFSGWFVWMFLSYLLFIVKGFSLVPYGFTRFESFPPEFVFYYYLCLITVLIIFKFKKQLTIILRKSKNFIPSTVSEKTRWRWLFMPLALLCFLSVSFAASLPDTNTHVVFLNVGQGDATLIKHGSQQILIDGGPDGNTLLLEMGKHLPFWDKTIELVVLTHPDADHLTGLLEVIRKYRVQKVMTPPVSEVTTDLYQRWLSLVTEKKIDTITANAGMIINLENSLYAEVLNPILTSGFHYHEDDNSIVLKLHSSDVNFLFTGDISSQGEAEILSRMYNLSSAVLNVSHHGSRNATSREFLNAVRPTIAIISAGKDNSYGHPHQETLERLNSSPGLQEIYRTDLNGAIEVITNGKRLWVKMTKS